LFYLATYSKMQISEKFINKIFLTSLTMEIEITKMTSKGQVVIPQDVREEANIAEGEKFFVYTSGDSIILKRTKGFKAAKSKAEFERVFKSAWKTAKERGITRKDVEQEIKAVRSNKRHA